jgi:hypothetical protein
VYQLLCLTVTNYHRPSIVIGQCLPQKLESIPFAFVSLIRVTRRCYMVEQHEPVDVWFEQRVHHLLTPFFVWFIK